MIPREESVLAVLGADNEEAEEEQALLDEVDRLHDLAERADEVLWSMGADQRAFLRAVREAREPCFPASDGEELGESDGEAAPQTEQALAGCEKSGRPAEA